MPMLDADDFSLSYEVSGEAGETIVFVHAFPVSRTMWRPQKEALARPRRVVVYDCRGFGQSDAPSREEEYSQTRSVDDLKAVLRTTSPNGAVIYGLSMGGNIALELAQSHPHQIKGLILASTGAGSDNPDEFRERVNGWADLALSDGIAAFAEMIMKVPTFAEYANRGQNERRWMYDAIIANSAHGVAHTARRVLGERPTLYEWEDGLRELTVPTLVLAGEYDEPCCKMGAYLVRTIPDAEFTVVPGVGHFMNLEAPTEFNAAVVAFLDKTEQRLSGVST
jgi:pimeloyl-ACP methyl ester carboxylesterase